MIRLQEILRILLLGAIFLFALPCTALGEEGQKNLSFDLFLARGFLGGTDYERFHFAKNVLWFECGELTDKPKTEFEKIRGDSVLPSNARLKISERYVKKLDDSALVKLKSATQKVLAIDGSLPPPDGVFGISASGVVDAKMQLNGKSAVITSSVDEISEAQTGNEKSLKQFIETVRGAGDVMCGSRTFFGLGRG